MKVHTFAGWFAVALALSGCGGNDAESEGFGDVAFTTYQVDRTKIVFTTDSKARKTWANMSGPAIDGSYTKDGNEIEIQWDPKASHHGSTSEKFRQMGPCSLARYERVDMEGVVHDDRPEIYQRAKPVCDTVRVTN